MATVHIIHGFIAFGKSTLAAKLAKELPAVLFNYDLISRKLYDFEKMSDQEFKERMDLMDDFIWDCIGQIIKCGADVVLDCGPRSKKSRKRIYDTAKQFTDNIIFHSIVMEPAVARERLIKRNQETTGQGHVLLKFFDEKLPRYEPITDDEGYPVKYYSNESGLELLK